MAGCSSTSGREIVTVAEKRSSRNGCSNCSSGCNSRVSTSGVAMMIVVVMKFVIIDL